MQRHRLGRTPFEVAPLALGGNVFGWTADEATSFRLLDAFVAGGGNLIDTANSYSRWVTGHVGGESETVIGKWIARRGHHDDVVIATKVGSDMGQGGKCLRRDYILRAVDESLRRLNVDAIDLYQSHWDDETTSFDETLDAVAVQDIGERVERRELPIFLFLALQVMDLAALLAMPAAQQQPL